MPERGHTEEQILQALRQVEGGEKAVEICRKLGISEQTFYTWKRKYSGIGLSELRELRQLRDENAKLKKLVADLSLDRHMLQESSAADGGVELAATGPAELSHFSSGPAARSRSA